MTGIEGFLTPLMNIELILLIAAVSSSGSMSAPSPAFL